MAHKVGYQYHNLLTYQRGYSAAEEQHLFDHFARVQPGASLFLDNEGRAIRAHQLVPGCAVVVRSWRDDEGGLYDKLSPEQTFELYKNTPKGIIRNLLNEPDGYGNLRKIATWCARVMDLFGAAGIPVVVPNFGEGHPDVDRLAELEELWAAFNRWHGLHYYGCHEYGTYRGMLFNEAGKWDVFPWRVGRFETFVVPYLQRAGHQVPNVILTEFGCDSAHDGTDKRGWKTHWTQKQYFDEIQAAVQKIYAKSHYTGLCLFSYGNTGRQFSESDWATFDVAEASEFQQLMEGAAPPASNPPPVVVQPTPAPAPKPIGLPVFPTSFALRARDGLLSSTVPILNIRELPTVKARAVGMLTPSAVPGKYIPEDELAPAEAVIETIDSKEGIWIPIAMGEMQGWVFSEYAQIKPIQIKQVDKTRLRFLAGEMRRLLDEVVETIGE